MTFDDGAQAQSRYTGAGFRLEPEFRDGSGAPLSPGGLVPGGGPSAVGVTVAPLVPGMVSTLGTGTPIASLPPGPSAATPAPAEPPTLVTVPKRFASLQYVFDDPAEGEPGKDRLLIHGLWELLLTLALVAGCLLLHGVAPLTFQSAGLPTLTLAVASLCVLGTAVGLSLRAGAVNLSVGAVVVAAGIYVGAHPGAGFGSSLAVSVALAAAVGAVLGLVVVGLQVPAWAASLGGFMTVSVWVFLNQDRTFVGGLYDPAPDAYWWFGCAAGLSVVAGIVGTWRTVRRGLGRFRPVVDPAQRRGGIAAAVVVGSFIISTMLAAVVGGLSVAMNHPLAPSDGTNETALALGVALLGGTSAFGRRGGILGTVLAAAIVVVFSQYAAHEAPRWNTMAFAAAAIGVGLVATRLVERYGRPVPGKPIDEPVGSADWAPKQHAAGAAQPSLWGSEDAWGTPASR
jgi:ribose/xylose/arabinose/galactoside ABC-type transport system permease subunit